MSKSNQFNHSAPRLEVQYKMLKKFDVVSCRGYGGSQMFYGVVRTVKSDEPELVWVNPHGRSHHRVRPRYKYTLIHCMDEIGDVGLRNAVTDVLHTVLTESD